jgi:hypothetical protein
VHLRSLARDTAPKHAYVQAYRQRDAALSLLVIEPGLSGVRGDPRFKALLRKMNFPACRAGSARSAMQHEVVAIFPERGDSEMDPMLQEPRDEVHVA